jgi:hypothetical protein
MRPITASELLGLWENGLSQPAWQRALSLLAAMLPDSTWDNLADLPLGQRDAHLLDLRVGLFGPRFSSLAVCPSCAERLELSFAVDDIRAREGLPLSAGESQHSGGGLSLVDGDYQVAFRLPNSRDLAEISRLTDPALAKLTLFERCLISAEKEGKSQKISDLPEPIIASVIDRMAEADPQGRVLINLTCPACANQWQADFDIFSFLWAEVDAWAQRLLREIHLLASAYGWPEADILALSPRRRQAYLQMVMGTR